VAQRGGLLRGVDAVHKSDPYTHVAGQPDDGVDRGGDLRGLALLVADIAGAWMTAPYTLQCFLGVERSVVKTFLAIVMALMPLGQPV
jgi:hypothetical protein